MERNRMFLLIGGIVLLLGIGLYYSFQSGEEDGSDVVEESKGSLWQKKAFGIEYSNFPEAPQPDRDEKEASRLWSYALEPKDPRIVEKVKKEWEDFARIYPNNIYIPREILGTSLTSEEEKEILETLDSFTAMDAQFASYMAASRYAAPGTEPPPSPLSEKDANPQEMRRYFNYKIRELESRIQLIEYTMEKARLSSVDERTAKSDLEQWKKELAELREIQSKIPGS